jgi:hypothetical protein
MKNKKDKQIVTTEEIATEAYSNGVSYIIGDWYQWDCFILEDEILHRDLIQAQKLYDKISKRLGI